MYLKRFHFDEHFMIQVPNEEIVEYPKEIYCVDSRPGLQLIVAGGEEDRAVVSIDGDFSSFKTLTDYRGKIFDAKINSAGNLVCFVGEDKDVIFYDLKAQKRFRYDCGDDCSVTSCSWSPNSSMLAFVNKKGILTLLEVSSELHTAKKIESWRISESELKADYLRGYNPTFITDEKLIVAGKQVLQTIYLQNDQWKYRVSTTLSHQDQIYMTALLRDSFIITISRDGKLKVWNLNLEMFIAERTLEKSNFVQRVSIEPSIDLVMWLDSSGYLSMSKLNIKGASQIMGSTQITEEVEDSLPPAKEPAEFIEESLEQTEIKKFHHTMEEESASNPVQKDREPLEAPIDEGSADQFLESGKKLKRNENLMFTEEDEDQMKRDAGYEMMKQEPVDKDRIVKQRKFIDTYFSSFPQPTTVFGATYDQGKRNYLVWNMFGSVVSRVEGNISIIDIEYSMSDLPKKLVPNTNNFSMASVNYTGVLLASTGVIRDEDKYEDEEVDETLKLATLYFLNANRSIGWSKTMNENENIEAVTLGNGWSAVYTSKKLVRIFSAEGNDYVAFGFNRQVIGLANYENLLAILYHETFPFSGQQYPKVKVYNTTLMSVQFESSVHLSNGGRVKWFGFSEEGILYVQDTKHMVWGLINEDIWVPVYDGSMKKDLWILGITEESIIAIKLPPGETEPSTMVSYIPQKVAFKVPLLSEKNIYKDIALKSIRSEQENFRTSLWGNMKNDTYDSQETGNPMEVNRQTIKSREELEKMKTEADKLRIELIRECLLEGNTNEAFSIGLQLEMPKTLEMCCKLMEAMKQGALASRLKIESEKIGRIQFNRRTIGNTVFIPQQITVRDQSVETSLTQANQIASVIKPAAESQPIPSNTLRMNQSSFKDMFPDGAKENEQRDKRSEHTQSIKSSMVAVVDRRTRKRGPKRNRTPVWTSSEASQK